MRSALMLHEQSRLTRKPQERQHLSPPPPPQPEPPSLQQLTLEDISPKWASRLKKENIPTFMSTTWLLWRFELQKTSKCVVGEAYGYSSHYTENCDECDRIGCKFLYYFTLNWRRKLELNKQEFVKHWNEEHSQ